MLAAAGPQEGLDHLLLLPECVLSMDSAQLKRDLAGLQFQLQLLSDGPHGSVWLSGDTPVDPKTPNSAKPDKEERLRILRERQNEERQRKLEEIKQQAMAAQKFREQKEEERRRRLEELRVRDSDRRLQVEERKRQIWEAERDRREAILRKNQEREARLETKRRNERSSIVFAFGSSTPRMLEPGDTGSAYWATRRATSTTNVMTLSLSATQPGPLTRRSSERELDGSKKRATSAGGIERKPLDGIRMSSSIYEVLQWGSSPPSTPVPHKSLYPLIPMESDVRRKKTDLSPVLRTAGSSSGLIGATGGSGDSSPRGGGKGTKPGRAYSMSRLDLLSRPVSRASLSAVKEPTAPVGPPPLRRGAAVSMVHLAPPRPTRAERLRKKAREQQAARSQSLDQPTSPGGRSGEVTPSRPTSSLSQASVASQLSAASLRMRTTPRKPRPASIAVTGVSSPGSDRGARSPNVSSSEKPPPIPKVHSVKKATPSKIDNAPKKPTKSTKSSTSTTPKGSTTPLQSPMVESGPQEESSGGAGEQSGSEEKTAALPHADCSNGPQPVAAGGGDLVSGVGGAGECHPTDTTSQSTLEPPPVLQISVGEASAPSGQQPSEVPSLTAAPSASVPPPEQATESKSQPVESKSQPAEPKSQPAEPKSQPSEPKSQPAEPKSQALTESGLDLSEVDMTASMMARTRITTEEEAKAALAERRRLAREQAEREAELERQRLEAERLAEEERQRREEEEQRRLEEEQLRLLEEARKAEELRLHQAIEEAKKREEEEKKRREEEHKQKLEREEAEKKAKEEAEKQRIEMEIRLKKEEEDRQARRKRVEAIMLRTRGRGSTASNTTPSKEGEESEENSPPDEVKSATQSEHNDFLNSERSHSDANAPPPNNAPSPPAPLRVENNNKHNGHHNGSIDPLSENNVTNSLLDLGGPADHHLLELAAQGNGKLPEASPFIENNQSPHQVNDLLS